MRPFVLLLVLAPLALAQEGLPEGFLPLSSVPAFAADPERAAKAPGYLGVQFDDVSVLSGCKITSIVEGSSAEAAGLAAGDIIVSFDRIETPNGSQLVQVVRSKTEGEAIEAEVYRDGAPRKVPITMKKVDGRLLLGIQFDEGVPVADVGGVKLGHVEPGTPAAKAGLKEGDVVVEFDGVPVPDKESFVPLVQSLVEGDEVALVARRGAERLSVTLTLGANRALARGRREREVARSFRLAVLLVEFADVHHAAISDAKAVETMFFSRGTYVDRSPSGERVYGSVADFYAEISCGVFALEGKVFDWVTLDSKKEDWKNEDMDEGVDRFLQEAFRKVVERDGANAFDGYEGVTAIYAGRVEHPRGRALWPHRSSVRVPGRGRRGVPYYVMSEVEGYRATFAGIATHCHEFGHMLGLPDQYSEVPGKGMDLGVWCLMAEGNAGSRRGAEHRPLHMCPWCKIQLGWLEARSIDPRAESRIALAPVERSNDQCVRIPLRPTGNEYLLLEYRGGLGFDETIPRTGLLVWHVSSGSNVDLIEAHGELRSDLRLREIPFPTSGRDSLVVDEALADLKTSDRGRWEVKVSGIVETKGKFVQLVIGPPAGPKGE